MKFPLGGGVEKGSTPRNNGECNAMLSTYLPALCSRLELQATGSDPLAPLSHVHDPGIHHPPARVITFGKEVLDGLEKASLVLFIGLGRSDCSLRLSCGLSNWGNDGF